MKTINLNQSLMTTKKELGRVIQELKKPLSKDERYKLECMQLQLEFEIDYADAVDIVNNRDLLM